MIKLTYESSEPNPFPRNIAPVPVSAARICVDDIQYDETLGTVKIPLKRKKFLGWKKLFFFGKVPVTSEPIIDALLTIRDVTAMDMQVDDVLVKECDSRFTVMVGLHVKDNELYLGSVEEDRGKTLCHIFIKVKKINIEFVDIETPN